MKNETLNTSPNHLSVKNYSKACFKYSLEKDIWHITVNTVDSHT